MGCELQVSQSQVSVTGFTNLSSRFTVQQSALGILSMAPVQFGCAALSDPCLERAGKDRGVFEMFAAWQKREHSWTNLQRSDCCFAEDHGRFEATQIKQSWKGL